MTADFASFLPDPEQEMESVRIGEIELGYRKKDGGGKHYLGRTHSEEYLSRYYPLLRKALSPVACIDIGANYGYVGLLMRRAFPDAHLTLVEPIPWLEDYIKFNFMKNGTHVDDLRSAICSVTSNGDRSSFGVRDTGSQDSRVVSQPGMRSIETDVVALDSLTVGLAPDAGVYIKIDTQGWEEHVFASGEGFLGTHDKWFVKTEFAPDWLVSQGTDPVELLSYLLARYDVHESIGRAPWNAESMSDITGRPLVAGCERDFVTYVRNLALNDRGWIDLYVMPKADRRGYSIAENGL